MSLHRDNPTEKDQVFQRYREYAANMPTDDASPRLVDALHDLDKAVSRAEERLRRASVTVPAGTRRLDHWFLGRKWALTGLAERAVERMTRRAGRHPYLLTVLATVFTAAASGMILLRSFLPAVLLLGVAAVFEVVDAANAKQAFDGRVGVFVDYVADRVGDLLIFGSIAFASGEVTRWLAVATLVISFLASYVRAEAGALRLSPLVSHVGRAERILMVLAGLFASIFAPVNGLRVTIGLSLLLAIITLAERFYNAVAGRNVLPPPFSWAPDEFLPRLVDDVVDAAIDGGVDEVLIVARDPYPRADGWLAVGSVRVRGDQLPEVSLFPDAPFGRR